MIPVRMVTASWYVICLFILARVKISRQQWRGRFSMRRKLLNGQFEIPLQPLLISTGLPMAQCIVERWELVARKEGVDQ